MCPEESYVGFLHIGHRVPSSASAWGFSNFTFVNVTLARANHMECPIQGLEKQKSLGRRGIPLFIFEIYLKESQWGTNKNRVRVWSFALLAQSVLWLEFREESVPKQKNKGKCLLRVIKSSCDNFSLLVTQVKTWLGSTFKIQQASLASSQCLYW